MTPPEIAQLKELLEKAPVGPYKITQESIDKEWYIMTAPGGRILANIHIEAGNEMDAANADLLLSACNALPTLLTALESNQKRVEELEQTNRAKVDECARLSSAIKRALNDSESGNGWGPDVTACGYLRAALHPEAVCIGIDMASGPDVTICHNCDSELPEGCGGRFKDDGAACALNFTHPEAGGGEKNGK